MLYLLFGLVIILCGFFVYYDQKKNPDPEINRYTSIFFGIMGIFIIIFTLYS